MEYKLQINGNALLEIKTMLDRLKPNKNHHRWEVAETEFSEASSFVKTWSLHAHGQLLYSSINQTWRFLGSFKLSRKLQV